jgi:hypothetical protein
MQRLGRLAAGAALAGGLAIVTACGGGSLASTTPTNPTGTGPSATTFVIQNGQITPKTMTVPRGTQVTMMNSDSRSHEMFSDPHPEHTDCPELNQIGFLDVGQSRQSGNLNIARNCGFHDHNDPENKGLQGTITIQ